MKVCTVGLGFALSIVVSAAITTSAGSDSCGETSAGCSRAGILDQELCPIPTGTDSNDIENAHIACLCSNSNTEYWNALAQCQCSATGEQLRAYYCDGVSDFSEADSATGGVVAISATPTVAPSVTTNSLTEPVHSGATESQDASNTLSETVESTGTTSGLNSGTTGNTSSTKPTGSSTRSTASSNTSATATSNSNSTSNSSGTMSPNFILLVILALFR